MDAYDRDAMLERHQIREISLNVARRLRQLLDRNAYIPGAMAAEVDFSIRAINGIQRDIEQIMGGLPSDEALDFAILTHILGGQRHALDLLEILESKLQGNRGEYQRDSARAHEALLAVSREIEQDARLYATESIAMPNVARAAAHPPSHPASQPADRGRERDPRRGAAAPSARRPAGRQPPAARSAVAALRALFAKPLVVGAAAIALGATLVVGGAYLERLRKGAPVETVKTVAANASDDAGGRSAAASPAPATASVASAAPAMEQPYLVVLATRRSTEELQQDYRSFKSSYPDLLTTARARVDRVQGQDKETYYRLSLIPPQAHDDAKALCSSLRKAGLAGCWIKPVPLR